MARALRLIGVSAPKPRRAPLVDPRAGDVESDASSTEKRSLLSLAGGILAEVSFPKLLGAFALLVVVPAVLLGAAPLLVTMWFGTVATIPRSAGIWVTLVLVFALFALAWFGGPRLRHMVENSFWSLNALAVQPGYAALREALAHLAELIKRGASERRRSAVRATSAAIAGMLICVLGVWIARAVWPSTRWFGTLADLQSPGHLALFGLANSIVLVAGYCAVAGLVWGIADATMPQLHEIRSFRPRSAARRAWRVAHLSDIHVVGERYGFRLGSGRKGTRGNERLLNTLTRLEEVHRANPLDAILITGDLTDAGTSAEWAELLDVFDANPALADLIVALPGNHDVNIVDRANPARLDLPGSPKMRLRQVRTLSALEVIQGARVHVVTEDTGRVDTTTLTDSMRSHAAELTAFADNGSRRLSRSLERAWTTAFPMVLLPDRDDGLGIIALNSNAESHFSFTNALGLMSLDQAHALDTVFAQYPRAHWVVALHHHLVEHHRLGEGLGVRIGTTLINGNWFARRLQRIGERAVVMHGHRHIDLIGRCGTLTVVSAPSVVMGEPYFYVHTLGVDADGRLTLLEPERIQ
ncbi:MAG TPA: metallophosphoesterase [Gemmatimonadaceae bacterium]|nr:metallophosphoesterase [Gemmatimonadaceae bacterium]